MVATDRDTEDLATYRACEIPPARPAAAASRTSPDLDPLEFGDLLQSPIGMLPPREIL